MSVTLHDQNLSTLSIAALANLIAEDWPKATEVGTPTAFGNMGQHPANPYLTVMQGMHAVDPKGITYGMEDAKTIILYFLSNATHWRGETAKAIKAELKRRIK